MKSFGVCHTMESRLSEYIEEIKQNKLTIVNFSDKEKPTRLIETLINNQTVREFNISCGNLEVQEVKAIYTFLKDRQNIDQIELTYIQNKWETYNYYGGRGEIYGTGGSCNSYILVFENLVNILGVKLDLISFKVSSSKIKFEGAKLIAKNLTNNNSLKKLDIARNDIGNEGIKVILEALALSEAINYINFNNNKINDEGALYIEQFLKDNKSIESLDLLHNKITNIGFETLKQGLTCNQSLTKLDLSKNKLDNKSENFDSLKDSVEGLLKTHYFDKYIYNILKDQQDFAFIISEEYKYGQILELNNASKLKNYTKKDLTNHLNELDHKIKYHALKITPAPLEIILKSNKFASVMQTYIFKTNEKICLDQDELVAETIRLIKSTNPDDKLYSFYQLIESFEESLPKNTFTKEEKLAIKTYQVRPKYCDNFIGHLDKDIGIKDVSAFMAANVEEAIEIQQLCKIFKYYPPQQYLHEYFLNIFKQASDIYQEAGGYCINAVGKFSFKHTNKDFW